MLVQRHSRFLSRLAELAGASGAELPGQVQCGEKALQAEEPCVLETPDRMQWSARGLRRLRKSVSAVVLHGAKTAAFRSEIPSAVGLDGVHPNTATPRGGSREHAGLQSFLSNLYKIESCFKMICRFWPCDSSRCV